MKITKVENELTNLKITAEDGDVFYIPKDKARVKVSGSEIHISDLLGLSYFNESSKFILPSGTTGQIVDAINNYIYTDIGIGGYESINNSLVGALGADEVWIGSGDDLLNYSSAAITVLTDANLIQNGLEFQFSQTGEPESFITFAPKSLQQVAPSVYVAIHGQGRSARYFRIKVTNGSTPSTFFILKTTYHSTATPELVATINQTLSGLEDVRLVRAIATGETHGNTYQNAKIDTEGHQYVNVIDPNSTSGAIRTEENTPVIQSMFEYSINPQIFNIALTGSGTATQSDAMAVLSTTATTSSSSKISTIRTAKARASQGLNTYIDAITSQGIAGSTQYFGIIDDENGYAFGWNGASFGILIRKDSVDTWVSQDTWNIDNMDGSGQSGLDIDFTLSQSYKILFSNGLQDVSFYILDGRFGDYVICHRDKVPNEAVVSPILNTSLSLTAYCENDTNDTDIILKIKSMSSILEGKNFNTGVSQSKSNSKLAVTTLQNILTIRNHTTFNGKTNTQLAYLTEVSASADGAKNVAIYLIEDTTLGGTPNFQDINTNVSIMEYDTDGTTITGGKTLKTFLLDKTGKINENFDIANILDQIYIAPNKTLTLAAESSVASDIQVALNWKEDIN